MDFSVKQYRKKLLTLPFCMLIMSACGSDGMDNPEPSTGNGESTREITLTFNTDVPAVGTRADEQKNIISTGSYIDVLVYAIYDENGNLLDYFGEGIKSNVPQAFTENKIGDGQTAIPFKAVDNVTVRLSVNPDKKYRIACWAQYSGCDAYKTTDLKNVTVSYENVANNDETRDAFCKTELFSGNQGNVTVTLQRPLAQINVGTTGADYRSLMQSDYIYPNMTITKSQITVTGVANTLDVVNHKAEFKGTGSKDITFTYSNIPAFIQMEENEIPTDNKLWNGADSKEEFLTVKLNSDENGILPYKVNYPTVAKDGTYKTETFKYLSMCYVLVPFSLNSDGETTNGSTVGVTIELKDATGDTERALQARNIPSVPVNANYRTNILGGLQYMKDRQPVYPTDDPDDPDGPYTTTPPDDPDNPGGTIDPDDPDNPDDPKDPDIPTNQDDPTSIFNTLTFKVVIDPSFSWHHYINNNYTETEDSDPQPEPDQD